MNKEWQGPPIYGAVVVDGKTYPEFCNEITRFESDLLQLTVRNRDLLIKLLRCSDNHDLADSFSSIIEEMEGEDSVQFWETDFDE